MRQFRSSYAGGKGPDFGRQAALNVRGLRGDAGAIGAHRAGRQRPWIAVEQYGLCGDRCSVRQTQTCNATIGRIDLVDMGIVAARRLGDLSKHTDKLKQGVSLTFLATCAVALPIVNATLAIALAMFVGLREGDALLLVVLGASASYIAVPAAMRLALPQANPSIYLSMSIAITFPFNLLVGIPLYHQTLRCLGV